MTDVLVELRPESPRTLNSSALFDSEGSDSDNGMDAWLHQSLY